MIDEVGLSLGLNFERTRIPFSYGLKLIIRLVVFMLILEASLFLLRFLLSEVWMFGRPLRASRRLRGFHSLLITPLGHL
jgi:hypothetical protein